MRTLFPVFAFLLGALSLPAADLASSYAAQGTLIVTQFASAPYPHPRRAAGHQYGDKFFSAQEHYSDSSVAVFVPKGFRAKEPIDLVVHFHGWNNHVENVLSHYRLIEQLMASGRNAVLVVPQGPRDASDSFGGRLEDTNGFKLFVDEVLRTLQQRAGFKQDCVLGNIILSAHSGGYEAMAFILDRGGLTERVKEVWLFDALYAQTDKYVAWLDHQPGRLLNIYTEHGGTKVESEKLRDSLKKRPVALFAGNESDAKREDLRKPQPIFLFTDLQHDEVLEKHHTFQTFLETSFLPARQP